MSTTINTFHSSFNPPPIPPRSGHRGGPVLPANTPLVKFLSVMLLLLMIQTFGGFLYLFHRLNTMQDRSSDNEMNTLTQLQQCAGNDGGSDDVLYCSKLVESYKTVIKKVSQAEGRVALLTETGSSTIPQAKMVLSNTSTSQRTEMTNTLLWNSEHSVLNKISLSSSGSLKIQYPGYYLIESQVTFSKAHEKAMLWHAVMTNKTNRKDPEKLLVSYCSLPRRSAIPDMCTTSATGVFRLEKNQKLFVNVSDWQLVNMDSTKFGLFRLQD